MKTKDELLIKHKAWILNGFLLDNNPIAVSRIHDAMDEYAQEMVKFKDDEIDRLKKLIARKVWK